MLNEVETIPFKNFVSGNYKANEPNSVLDPIKEAQRAVLLTLALTVLSSSMHENTAHAREIQDGVNNTTIHYSEMHSSQIHSSQLHSSHINPSKLYRSVTLESNKEVTPKMTVNINAFREKAQNAREFIKDTIKDNVLEAPENPKEYNPSYIREYLSKAVDVKSDLLVDRSARTIDNMEKFIVGEMDKLEKTKEKEDINYIKRDIGTAYLVAQMESKAAVVYSSSAMDDEKEQAKKEYFKLRKEFMQIKDAYMTEDILNMIDSVSMACMVTPIGAEAGSLAKTATGVARKTATELVLKSGRVITFSEKILNEQRAINAARKAALETIVKSYKPKTLVLEKVESNQVRKMSITISKDTIKHAFERHHGSFWRFDNSKAIKSNQTFFRKDMSLQEFEETIFDVIKQNEDKIMSMQGKGWGSVIGKGKDNSWYVVGFNQSGEVGQFFKVKSSMIEYYKQKLGK